MYDVIHFLKKFSNIPADKFYGGYWWKEDEQKGCYMGHCGVVNGYKFTEEGTALQDLFATYLKMGLNVLCAKSSYAYPQLTSKARILAALNDIYEKQIAEANVIEASKIVNEVATI